MIDKGSGSNYRSFEFAKKRTNKVKLDPLEVVHTNNLQLESLTNTTVDFSGLYQK